MQVRPEGALRQGGLLGMSEHLSCCCGCLSLQSIAVYNRNCVTQITSYGPRICHVCALPPQRASLTRSGTGRMHISVTALLIRACIESLTSFCTLAAYRGVEHWRVQVRPEGALRQVGLRGMFEHLSGTARRYRLTCAAIYHNGRIENHAAQLSWRLRRLCSIAIW